MTNVIDWHNPDTMIGKRFGSVVVKKFVSTSKQVRPNGQSYVKETYLCLCDCGTSVELDGRNLVKGRALSCGRCVRTKTHGQSGDRLYRIWCNMKSRCYNQNIKKYCDYGGRGITICDEWRNDFEVFSNWAFANGYSDSLSIDRVDNNGCYSPDNCRWVSAEVQSRNQRTNNKYNGICITDWAKMLKVKRQTLSSYVNRNGWVAAIEHFNKPMQQSIYDIAFWHSCFFPDATLEGQVEKWYDEQKEFIDSQDPEEFVDMFIVACGIARFSIEKAIPKFAVVFNNLIDEEWGKFQELVNKKMAVNRNRVWAKGKGNYQHIEGV